LLSLRKKPQIRTEERENVSLNQEFLEPQRQAITTAALLIDAVAQALTLAPLVKILLKKSLQTKKFRSK
jgi:hypothetical protein